LIEILHLSILVTIVIAGFLTIWFRNLLSSVISLAVLSLFISLEFFYMQAPDVAIAEAGIGAGLSTAIYIIGLRACGKKQFRKEGER
jgi:energy-converting hydrogenase B subunit D